VEYVGVAPLEGSDDRKLIATLREGSPAPAPSSVLVASAKPFVPAAAYRGLNGPAPLPPERPYDLGDGDTPAATAGGQRVSVRRVPVNVAVTPLPDLRLAEPRRATSAPVVSYAPARYEAPPVASGRGIY
jgi:rare lipoprotein A